MAHFMWLIPLVCVVSCGADVIEWEELKIEQLDTHDDNNRVVVIAHVLLREFAIRLKCPKPYVIYPRNEDEGAGDDPHAFVEAGGTFVEVPLSEVIHSLYGKPLLRQYQDEECNVMELHYPGNMDVTDPDVVNIIRREATRLYFFCALPTFNVGTTLSRKPHKFVSTDHAHLVSLWYDTVKYLKHKAHEIGLFAIDIRKIHKATHGCGSKDTPEFMNEVHHDVESGVRSCTVDITEHPHVGFYCDGIVQPKYCFVELLDTNNPEDFVSTAITDIASSVDDRWLFASYYRKGIRKGFSGYCQCVDEETGQVKAQINIMTGMSHVCDINGMVFKNKARPIIGNWCDVALLPGSTLTIKVPLNIYDDEIPKIGGGKAAEPSRMISYMYPQDMKNYFLDNEDYMYDSHPPQLHESSKYILGDALYIDQSREKDEGIITMTYRENAPLTYPYGIDGLSYTWNLKSNKDILDIRDTMAIINVVPIITHSYSMYGCEPPSSSVFSKAYKNKTNKQELDIYGQKMYVCQTYPIVGLKYGLYCPQGYTMEPRNCNGYAYNAALDSIEDFTHLIKVETNPLLSYMRFFQYDFRMSQSRKYSNSCSCLDKDGIERARIVLSNYIQQYAYFVGLGHKESMSMVVPIVNIIDGRIDGKRLPEIQEIPFPFPFPKKTIVISRGVHKFLNGLAPFIHPHTRFINLNGRTEPFLTRFNSIINDDVEEDVAHNQWECSELSSHDAILLPLNIKKYFYHEVKTDGKGKLVPVEYSKVLGTNAAGFKVQLNFYALEIYDYDSMTLMNPMSSIIVSKTNADVINLKYACGKLTNRHNIIENVVGDNMDDGWESIDETEDVDLELETDDETEIMNLEDDQSISLATPGFSGSDYPVIENDNSLATSDVKETRSLTVFGVINIAVHPTDPYLHGCGMTDPSEELFRDDTVPLLNNANEKIGCEVDIAEGDASFYCPLPYHTEPPRCIPTSTGAFNVKQPGGKGNRHFYIFTKGGMDSSDDSMLHVTKREVFECHCVTNKGIRMATIRVHA
ncbi:hypothetical protein BgAZ_403780 [Babesia gibsoni]|uniref:6-Cys domain-containing protein n=1 Tax=Babesia gibsoni TaxID=33632 RepID=A0AAD8LJ22_BABGI|nr:hypothetical protein BgAZ_403780 [Babesia gibsoni]